jgi:hypothetical protein
MRSRTANHQMGKHAVAVLVIVAIAIYTIIVVVLFGTHPTPPPDTVYTQVILSGLVILAISIGIAAVLRIKGVEFNVLG